MTATDLEGFLNFCGAFFNADLPTALSILLAGLTGGVTHCAVMCSPSVAAQMLEAHVNGEPRVFMAAYHAGRISAYMLLGVLANMAGGLIFGGKLAAFAPVMIAAAGLLFLGSALFPRKTHSCCGETTRGLRALTDAVFHGKTRFYARGFLGGFMPCGMTIALLLAVSQAANPFAAASLTALFGLATVPALQAAGLAALHIGKRIPRGGRHIGRAATAFNGCWLLTLAAGRIFF